MEAESASGVEAEPVSGVPPGPRVSVVVPVFNRADLLGATLESVATQTFADWECIVVDDGSTDHTPQVAQAFAVRDARFRCLRQANSSAAAARNRGLAAARGELIVFLDSDDLLPADRLQWQVDAMAADPTAVLVYGDTFQFVRGDVRQGSVYRSDVVDKPAGQAFEALLLCSHVYAPLVRTAAVRRLGGFDTRLASAEDWDMWLRLAKVGELRFQPRIALYYRVHEGNKSAHTLRNYRCAWQVVHKHVAELPWRRRRVLLRGVRRYFRRVYPTPLLRDAFALTKAGDWRAARQVWRALLWLRPAALDSRSAVAHALWALLPAPMPPPWSCR